MKQLFIVVAMFQIGASQILLSGNISLQARLEADLRAAIRSSIRDQFVKMAEYEPPRFELVSYLGGAADLVYYAKVRLDNNIQSGECAHLKIVKQLVPSLLQAKNEFLLVAYQRGKAAVDVLVPFEAEQSSTQAPPSSSPAPYDIAKGLDLVINAREKASLQAALGSYIKAEFEERSNFTAGLFDYIAAAKKESKLSAIYIVKVNISSEQEEYAHLKLQRPLALLNQRFQLDAYLRGMDLNDSLAMFEKQRRPDWSDVQAASDNIAALVQEVRANFAARSRYYPHMFNAISYRYENLLGVVENYVVKVQYDANAYAHIYISKAVSQSAETISVARLVAFQARKKLADELVVFLNAAEQQKTYLVAQSVGVFSYAQSAGEEAQIQAEAVRARFLQAIGQQSAEMFVAVKERVQAGLNLVRYVKVQTASEAFVHLKIAQMGAETAQLVSFQANHSANSAIEIF